jgi:hypothetical protein
LEKLTTTVIANIHVVDFTLNNNRYQLFDDITQIKEIWDVFTSNDLYFSSAYLNVIQNSPSLGIKPYYLLEYANSEIKRVFYYQLKTFNLQESLRSNDDVNQNFLKKGASKLISFNTLINGNILLTGKYGIYDNEIDQKLNVADLESINEIVCQKITKLTGSKPGGFLIKDFYNSEIEKKPGAKTFTDFVVHPNMVMDIPQNWKSLDDYIAALNTKYRTRYKRAVKKLQDITVRELNLEEIIFFQTDMHRLYQNIALNADFNLFILPNDYFVKFKEVFQDHLMVKGYFKEDKLVGFYTCLNNLGRMDAHFLGYEQSLNAEHQLYLNMLFDMIKLGIDKSCVRIFMSRTAIEIKNSVGAIPHGMICFFRHNNPLVNTFVKPIFEYYKPKNNYILRSPFKSEIDKPENIALVEEQSCRLRKLVCKK